MEKTFLFIDTETSGFVKKDLRATNPDQAWMVQFAGILATKTKAYQEECFLLECHGRSIHEGAHAIHGYSIDDCWNYAVSDEYAHHTILNMISKCDCMVFHNKNFDMKFIELFNEWCEDGLDLSEVEKKTNKTLLQLTPSFCTMESSTSMLKLSGKNGYKWPKLEELYEHLFKKQSECKLHNAMNDARTTMECFFHPEFIEHCKIELEM